MEESGEVVEAIEHHDMQNLEEELGDVLLQVVMHARIAEERGDFNFSDVVDGAVSYTHLDVYKRQPPNWSKWT